jgi:hypothetical protein
MKISISHDVPAGVFQRIRKLIDISELHDIELQQCASITVARGEFTEADDHVSVEECQVFRAVQHLIAGQYDERFTPFGRTTEQMQDEAKSAGSFPGFTPDVDGRLWNAGATLGLVIDDDAVTLLDEDGYPADCRLSADEARHILEKSRMRHDTPRSTMRRWNTYGSWLQGERKLSGREL